VFNGTTLAGSLMVKTSYLEINNIFKEKTDRSVRGFLNCILNTRY